ncbi:DUF1542 domain-containing protein [Fructobacillus sp. CRL 2054]|uniref:KxYKxGKxW signal peptide domain-containing protein n=1 Tax=Fructobacillus sp. CRL 2054 TaxID=2763007 RepID=UPI002379AB28|nr:DUF1542 domain-containing protein [Fructobacillus sp. CRL 2054]MDD9139119.1 DUF1542 domain-containing protein [Fructobacillus sp. CRL 2054]
MSFEKRVSRERVVRKQLRKVKKNWVVASATTLAFLFAGQALSGQSLSASDNQPDKQLVQADGAGKTQPTVGYSNDGLNVDDNDKTTYSYSNPGNANKSVFLVGMNQNIKVNVDGKLYKTFSARAALTRYSKVDENGHRNWYFDKVDVNGSQPGITFGPNAKYIATTDQSVRFFFSPLNFTADQKVTYPDSYSLPELKTNQLDFVSLSQTENGQNIADYVQTTENGLFGFMNKNSYADKEAVGQPYRMAIGSNQDYSVLKHGENTVDITLNLKSKTHVVTTQKKVTRTIHFRDANGQKIAGMSDVNWPVTLNISQTVSDFDGSAIGTPTVTVAPGSANQAWSVYQPAQSTDDYRLKNVLDSKGQVVSGNQLPAVNDFDIHSDNQEYTAVYEDRVGMVSASDDLPKLIKEQLQKSMTRTVHFQSADEEHKQLLPDKSETVSMVGTALYDYHTKQLVHPDQITWKLADGSAQSWSDINLDKKIQNKGDAYVNPVVHSGSLQGRTFAPTDPAVNEEVIVYYDSQAKIDGQKKEAKSGLEQYAQKTIDSIQKDDSLSTAEKAKQKDAVNGVLGELEDKLADLNTSEAIDQAVNEGKAALDKEHQPGEKIADQKKDAAKALDEAAKQVIDEIQQDQNLSQDEKAKQVDAVKKALQKLEEDLTGLKTADEINQAIDQAKKTLADQYQPASDDGKKGHDADNDQPGNKDGDDQPGTDGNGQPDANGKKPDGTDSNKDGQAGNGDDKK